MNRAYYQSINNKDGAFFSGSTPAGSISAGKMMELMAATQGQLPEAGSKKSQRPPPSQVVVQAGQKWLSRWRLSRQQPEKRVEDGVMASSQVRINGIRRRRSKDVVHYSAETEKGVLFVSVPLGSPEAKAFEQLTVSEVDTAKTSRGSKS
jgi:hypothetical protein